MADRISPVSLLYSDEVSEANLSMCQRGAAAKRLWEKRLDCAVQRWTMNEDQKEAPMQKLQRNLNAVRASRRLAIGTRHRLPIEITPFECKCSQALGHLLQEDCEKEVVKETLQLLLKEAGEDKSGARFVERKLQVLEKKFGRILDLMEQAATQILQVRLIPGLIAPGIAAQAEGDDGVKTHMEQVQKAEVTLRQMEGITKELGRTRAAFKKLYVGMHPHLAPSCWANHRMVWQDSPSEQTVVCACCDTASRQPCKANTSSKEGSPRPAGLNERPAGPQEKMWCCEECADLGDSFWVCGRCSKGHAQSEVDRWFSCISPALDLGWERAMLEARCAVFSAREAAQLREKLALISSDDTSSTVEGLSTSEGEADRALSSSDSSSSVRALPVEEAGETETTADRADRALSSSASSNSVNCFPVEAAEEIETTASSVNAEVSSTKFADEDDDASSKTTMADEDENKQRMLVSREASATISTDTCDDDSPPSFLQPTPMKARDLMCIGSQIQSPSWTQSSGCSPKGRPPSLTVPTGHVATARSSYLDVNLRAGERNFLEPSSLAVMEPLSPRSPRSPRSLLSRRRKIVGKELEDFCLEGRRMSPACMSATLEGEESEKRAEITKKPGSVLVPVPPKGGATSKATPCSSRRPRSARSSARGCAASGLVEARDANLGRAATPEAPAAAAATQRVTVAVAAQRATGAAAAAPAQVTLRAARRASTPALATAPSELPEVQQHLNSGSWRTNRPGRDNLLFFHAELAQHGTRVQRIATPRKASMHA